MNLKRWEVAALDKDRAAQLAERYSIPYFLAMLLEIRGFHTEEQLAGVLGTATLSDPFLMKDMDRAVARIRKAIDGFEKIAIYGDYDADGVTSTSMLFTYLEAVGADVFYYIPQREGEGYGMNCGAVQHLCDLGVKLIVTVDNGISSFEEVKLAKELGIDVVVTDHHRPHEFLPDAVAVVDAYRVDDESPYKDFSGAGVVLKLLIALEDGDAQGVLEEYADLAALGTVGDVVPVVGENRLIVQAGLRSIMNRSRPGVSALLDRCFSGGELTATGLAFTLIPRLNATGRMGSPEKAVRLLCCEDEEESAALAEEICEDNERRRQIEAEILEEAMARLQEDPSMLHDRVMVVSGHGWHHGVIGIVAARMTERYGKPCFVVSEDGSSAKGSGRSVEGFSLFNAVTYCKNVLERFGGHPMAAGVTLKAEHVEEFRRLLNEYAAKTCPEMPAPCIQLDCRLKPATLSVDMPRDLRRLEPFGSGNLQPLFGLFNMELREIVPVGGGNHLRLVCQKQGAFVNCMRFGVKQEDFPFEPGDRLDLAVTLDAKEYRGEERLTVTVRDVRLSGLDDNEQIHSYRVYERYLRREPISAEDCTLLAPGREELAAVYRMLASLRGAGFGVESALGALAQWKITAGKLLLCFEIMSERGLLEYSLNGDRVNAKLLRTNGKVDILASPVLIQLQNLRENA